jgi:hypothetical protein
MRRCVFTGILTLFLLLAVGNLRAADESGGSDNTDSGESQSTNMQSWQEEWRDDKKESGWTWFGMGYESRRAFSDSRAGAGSGGPSKGQGGNGAGGSGSGGGKRR